MIQDFTRIDLSPVLPPWLLALAAAVALLALIPALLRRARGVWWRAAAFAALLLALANPRLISETRETRPDIALLLVDASDSTRLAGILALTDGQVHDVPAAAPADAPFHALLPSRPNGVSAA